MHLDKLNQWLFLVSQVAIRVARSYHTTEPRQYEPRVQRVHGSVAVGVAGAIIGLRMRQQEINHQRCKIARQVGTVGAANDGP